MTIEQLIDLLNALSALLNAIAYLIWVLRHPP